MIESFDDLDVSLGRMIGWSGIVLFVLLLFALLSLIGMFELTLRNAVGDIAILKHLGFPSDRINRI